jgi:hypothetical protein
MSDEANDSMPDFSQMPREWCSTGTTAGLPFVLDPA